MLNISKTDQATLTLTLNALERMSDRLGASSHTHDSANNMAVTLAAHVDTIREIIDPSPPWAADEDDQPCLTGLAI